MQVFNRHILPLKRQKAFETFSKADFLFRHAESILSDRLKDIKREFEYGVLLGARHSSNFYHDLAERIENLYCLDLIPTPNNHVIADEEFLPLRDASQDIILSLMTLHSINDLPGALVQIQRALKPDGVFMAAMLGGESLHEIRTIIQETEQQVLGGISPRIFPFADKPQMGELLQRTNYALPVIDSDIIRVSYKSTFDLWQDLRSMGETNIQIERFKGFTPKTFFEKLEENIAPLKNDNDRFDITFEIIYLIGWAPHTSQQQPLRPGSAEISMADALKTTEQDL